MTVRLVETGLPQIDGGCPTGRQRDADLGHARIPGKHGAAPTSYRQVVVTIPDAPGALARLFTDVGAEGVNVEDIAIEHDQDRQIGYLALSVAPDRADGLVASMQGKGWSVG